MAGAANGSATNLLAARLLDDLARMLRVQEAQSYRVRAYSKAARGVAACPEPLEILHAEGRLREIPGVGPAMAALLAELVETGRIGLRERLAASTPPGLAELLRLPGIGPRTARAFHETLGIGDLAGLEQAILDGRLAGAGFDRADVPALLEAIARAREGGEQVRLKPAWETARLLVEALTEGPAPPRRIEVAGDARRMEATIAELDLVAMPGPQGAARLLEAFAGLPQVVELLHRDESVARVRLYEGLVTTLHLARAQAWGASLLWHTGSPAHLARLAALAEERGWRLSPDGLVADGGRLLAGKDEAGIYERLGLQEVPPELREDGGEIEAAREGRLPRLVTEADLKGDLHTHTEWTDGSQSLEEMARAAKTRGYAYMTLTDHTREMAFINGLTPERLAEQRRLVEQVNHELAPFVVLLGTEMDILADGRLDFPDEVLETLDYVSISVHRRFKQDREAMTQRIIQGVSHPLVHTLNHPHGRLIGSRDPYPVDMEQVIETAARSGCALEVSADPARMDLDGAWARQVKAAGGRCTISSDAHSTLDLENIWLGVGSARRGWLTPDDVLNTRPLEELQALLHDGVSK